MGQLEVYTCELLIVGKYERTSQKYTKYMISTFSFTFVQVNHYVYFDVSQHLPAANTLSIKTVACRGLSKFLKGHLVVLSSREPNLEIYFLVDKKSDATL